MSNLEMISEVFESKEKINLTELAEQRADFQAQMEAAQAGGNSELAKFYAGEISELDQKMRGNEGSEIKIEAEEKQKQGSQEQARVEASLNQVGEEYIGVAGCEAFCRKVHDGTAVHGTYT